MFHIVFNADENYIKYASVLMTNIIYKIDKSANYAQEPIHFHLLTNALSQTTQENLKTLSNALSAIYPCDITIYSVSEKAFENLPAFKGNHSAYWRLLIADYLPSKIQKCLYLDVDMLVLCDIREIFDIPCDSALAAIPDLSKRTGRIIESKNATNPPIALNHYFNSGFLYFNLPKFRQQFQQKFPASNILEQSLKLSKQYQLRFHDQDTLNAIIQDDYQPLCL